MPDSIRLLVAAVLGTAAFASAAAGPRPFVVQGQKDYHCWVGDKPEGGPDTEPCGTTTFKIQVFPVLDTKDKNSGCLAAMPYNTIQITYNGKKGTGSLKWTLPPDASFLDEGVAITAPDIDTKDKTFKEVGPVSANGKDFEVKLRPGNDKSPALKRRLSYAHTPMVSYKDPKTGTTFDCLGVDPIIINSEN